MYGDNFPLGYIESGCRRVCKVRSPYEHNLYEGAEPIPDVGATEV